MAIEEAKASPTGAGQPGIVKRKFDITPQIGGNDVLFTIRSDSSVIAQDVLKWLRGNSTTLNGQSIPAPAAGRTSSARRGGTGPSRCWS